MSFSGVLIDADQARAGRIAVYVGAADTVAPTYQTVATTMYSVGACDGTVSVSSNQDVIKLNRSDGQNPYGVLETGYDFQVSFNLQEADIYNLALACGYNTSIHQYTDARDFDTGGIYTNRMAQELTPVSVQIDGAAVTIKVEEATLGLDGLAENHAVIISDATNAEIKKLNGRVLVVSSYVGSGDPDIANIILSTVQNEWVGDTGGAITTGVGTVRRLWPVDALITTTDDLMTIDLIDANTSVRAWEYNATATDSSSLERQDSTDNSLRIAVGDHITIRGITNSDYKVLNGYPLRITSAGSGETAAVSISEFDTLLATTASLDEPSGGAVDDDTLASGLDNHTAGWVDGARYLQLGSQNQSPYRSLMFRTESGGDSATADEWHFFKCKLVYGGSIDYDRTGAVTYPVTAHVLGNNQDVVGKYLTNSTYSRASRYGDSV